MTCRRTVKEDILVEIMRANGGRVPTLEEFLNWISPDGVPEDGAELEIDIPAMVSNLEAKNG